MSTSGSFQRMWDDLSDIGRDPEGGYRRFAYSAPELELREWFGDQAAVRGLDLTEDRAGNLWAWWGQPGDGDGVVTGSHLDSVPNGGAFDGPLGVVSGFAAIDLLRDRGVTPRRPLAVAAFADEEGGRFGIACAGSRLLTGRLDPERALALRDDDGITLAEALERSGRDPRRLGSDPEALRRIGAFIELHVEQGRGLVHLDAPIGVASAIRPHGRWRFDLHGRADHAGTTAMGDRDDPMLRHARVILAARAAAAGDRASDSAVATVGRVQVRPNGVNAIPSLVRTWLDARADSEAEVRRIVAEVTRAAGVDPVEESWTPAVQMSTELTQRIRRTLGDPPLLATGAGHDAGILRSAGVPAAMLFVRNPTGVSHAPDEHAEVEDCLAGVEALAAVLADLVCGPPPEGAA